MSDNVSKLVPHMDVFLMVDALRAWQGWREYYDEPTIMKTMNYVPFMDDPAALAEQIEAMERGLA